MPSLIKALAILCAVLSVRAFCSNGNKAGGSQKIVIEMKGLNKTRDCQLRDPLTPEISNLLDGAFARVVRYRFGRRVPSKFFFNRTLIRLWKH